MTTTATVDYSAFENKKVKLVRNLPKPNEKGEGAEELEGTILATNESAIMFKQKGKTNAILIDVNDIESIEHAEGTAKKLGRKTLKVVQFGQARTHLLERHGRTLSAVNAMSEKQAFDEHEAIDHEKEDLGHVHRDKSKDEVDPDEE